MEIQEEGGDRCAASRERLRIKGALCSFEEEVSREEGNLGW